MILKVSFSRTTKIRRSWSLGILLIELARLYCQSYFIIKITFKTRNKACKAKLSRGLVFVKKKYSEKITSISFSFSEARPNVEGKVFQFDSHILKGEVISVFQMLYPMLEGNQHILVPRVVFKEISWFILPSSSSTSTSTSTGAESTLVPIDPASQPSTQTPTHPAGKVSSHVNYSNGC